MESRFRRNCPCLNHPPFAATGGIALDAMRPCISASSSIATWSTPFGCEGSGYSKLWKSKRFVLGGGEISGSRCDVASSWCLSCLCFLHLMVYREFFMDTMQMVVAIPLCFGSFSFVPVVPRKAVAEVSKIGNL